MGYRRLKVVAVSTVACLVALAAPGVARATTVKEFTSGVSGPAALTSGADGDVWFINGAGLAKIDPTGHVTNYTAGLDSGAAPFDLTSGPGGDLWFTDIGADAVGYITPGGAIHEYSAPSGELPLQIIAGSDGNIWFYSNGTTHAVVRMTPAGSFTAYPLPTLGEIADNMVLGPDGAVWFSDMGTNSIGKIAPNGTISEYQLAPGAIPTNITVGPDRNLWFSDNSGAIGSVTTAGFVQEFSSGLQPGAVPDAITPGPNGNVWFTDQFGGRRAIGMITPAGKITEFTNGLYQDLLLDITTGADGNLWVPQASLGGTTPSAVAEITPAGQITEITSGINPAGLQDGDSILAGPNGALWFTDSASPQAIGRIVLPPVAATGSATAITSTSATISGSVTPRADTTAVSIQYGTSSSLGTSVAAPVLAAGLSTHAVSAGLSALPAGTTIYYRVVAINSGGESDGALKSFTTAAGNQTTTKTFANQRITLITPATALCAASTSSLGATLSSTAIQHSSQPKLRFRDARFYIDKGIRHRSTKVVHKHGKRRKVTITTYRPNATATKLPAAPALSLSGLRSGAHRLKVTVRYTETVTKHRHKHNVVIATTLSAPFDVC